MTEMRAKMYMSSLGRDGGRDLRCSLIMKGSIIKVVLVGVAEIILQKDKTKVYNVLGDKVRFQIY